MTLDEVRARREEIYATAARYGVDRMTVLTRQEFSLPYDFDVYVEVHFTDEANARLDGLDYATALADLQDDLSALLRCNVGVGDLDGKTDPAWFGEKMARQAVPL
ncbi:MAG: hypothetical protein J2P39_06605 [Candidatus Dormibacteraeota bacterium]|nr:hypothetical protein [Candidatus Dormibacteraeota bacterium]